MMDSSNKLKEFIHRWDTIQRMVDKINHKRPVLRTIISWKGRRFVFNRSWEIPNG